MTIITFYSAEHNRFVSFLCYESKENYLEFYNFNPAVDFIISEIPYLENIKEEDENSFLCSNIGYNLQFRKNNLVFSKLGKKNSLKEVLNFRTFIRETISSNSGDINHQKDLLSLVVDGLQEFKKEQILSFVLSNSTIRTKFFSLIELEFKSFLKKKGTDLKKKKLPEIEQTPEVKQTN